MSNIWYQPNLDLQTIEESQYYEYALPLSDPSGTTTTVISGILPPGLRLNNNTISGMPFEVSLVTPYKFVIRAEQNGKISDRTFSIKISGPDASKWVTPEGLLPIGTNNAYYVLDESYVDFQLFAIDTDTISGQSLTFWLDPKNGTLPPGLTLSKTGRIYGFVRPLLVQPKKESSGFYDSNNYDSNLYDKGKLATYGYDDYFYDFLGYDYSEYFEQPKKLNKNYEFVVSISDGNSVETRKFKIYVVGDDALFADNEQIHAPDLDMTSDVTSLRDPIWFTESDLGVVRANNYQTLKLDIYDIVAKNPVVYSLNSFNPDGTPSVLPPGMQFDSATSEVFGVIPFQQAVTKQYNFTITSTRVGRLRSDATGNQQSDTYPLMVDGIMVYRNYGVEESSVGYFRVYQSIDYVEGLSGVQLKLPAENTLWIYKNNITNVVYYSDQGPLYPWEVLYWYTDELHTTQVTGPVIDIKPSVVDIYNDHYDTASAQRTFSLKVIGEIDNNIAWVTSSDLGILNAEQVCTLSVVAKCVNETKVNYFIVKGSLPPGLEMDSLGQIYGKVNQFIEPRVTKFDFTIDGGDTTIDRTYYFDVLASDIPQSVQIIRTFSITVSVPNEIQYSDIRVEPLLVPEQRDLFRLFISNNDVFERSSIYRLGDKNFGVQNSLSMLVYGGIKTAPITKYMEIVAQNHARKRFIFGDLKIAKAKIPGTHTVVYEVIYIEMLDPLEVGKIHLPNVIKTSKANSPITIDNDPFIVTIDRNNIRFNDSYSEYKQPSSISLWRQRISNIGYYGDISGGYIASTARDLTLLQQKDPGDYYKVSYNSYFKVGSDGTPFYATTGDKLVWNVAGTIDVIDKDASVSSTVIHDRTRLPLWMRSIQDGSMNELDYVPAITLCYCNPGMAEGIVLNINNYLKTTGFDFNQIDYIVDRYIVSAIGSPAEKQLFQMYHIYDYNDIVLYNDQLYSLKDDQYYTHSYTKTINNVDETVYLYIQLRNDGKYYNEARAIDERNLIPDTSATYQVYNNTFKGNFVLSNTYYFGEVVMYDSFPYLICDIIENAVLSESNSVKLINYKGEFDINTSYNLNELVMYNGDLYVCIVNNSTLLPTDHGHFRVYGSTYKQQYRKKFVYNIGDVVTYNNELYMSMAYAINAAITDTSVFTKVSNYQGMFKLYNTYYPGDKVGYNYGYIGYNIYGDMQYFNETSDATLSSLNTYITKRRVFGELPTELEYYSPSAYQEDKYVYFQNDRTQIS